ncbi:hypothetical protein ERJ75_001123500 [Trypanosoma vivax]|nr:hypothetical protein ERJ75_001123500 [Trypanosoma vivax]
MHCAPRTRSEGQRPRRGSQQILLTRGHQHWERGHKTDGRRSGLEGAETPFDGDKESVLAGKGACDTATTGRTRKGLARSEDCRYNARYLEGPDRKRVQTAARAPARLARRVDGSSSAPSLVVKRDRAQTGLRRQRRVYDPIGQRRRVTSQHEGHATTGWRQGRRLRAGGGSTD